MRIDIADKIRYHIDRMTDRAIMLNSELSRNGATDTVSLARMKKLCIQYLEFPLIQALDEDTE